MFAFWKKMKKGMFFLLMFIYMFHRRGDFKIPSALVADVSVLPKCQVTVVLSPFLLSSFKGQQDRAGSRLVVGADHQHQRCHAVWRRHVHLLSVHHASQNGQSLPDGSRWVTSLCYSPEANFSHHFGSC